MTKKLLVVDDALIIREIIKDTAVEAGWDIAGEADNGKDAVDLYRQLRPDVITLDLVMPQYDGIYALEGIIGSDPEAKVIVVSALDQKSVLQKAFKIGAADFIVKPFDTRQLTESLNCLADNTDGVQPERRLNSASR